MTPTVLALLLVLPLPGRAQAPMPKGQPGIPAARPAAAGEVGVEEHLGAALPIDVRFNDEDGRPFPLGDFIDKPTLLTLNYFRCAGICTPQLNGLVDGLNVLRLEPGQDFRVLTVSFDPQDEPLTARMKRQNYLKQLRRPFPPEAWRFLTGEPKAIRALTAAAGFSYQPAPGGQFVHPGVLLVVSPRGRITRYMYGVSFPAADLEMALREAGRGQARPSVIKALQFCYDYDPEGRKLVLRLSRLIGAGILILVLGTVGVLSFAGRKEIRPAGTGGTSDTAGGGRKTT